MSIIQVLEGRGSRGVSLGHAWATQKKLFFKLKPEECEPCVRCVEMEREDRFAIKSLLSNSLVSEGHSNCRDSLRSENQLSND